MQEPIARRSITRELGAWGPDTAGVACLALLDQRRGDGRAEERRDANSYSRELHSDGRSMRPGADQRKKGKSSERERDDRG